MPAYIYRTWPVSIAIAAPFAALAAIGRPGALATQIPEAIGMGLGAWLAAMLIVAIVRSTGRLRDDRASTRAVWAISLVFVVLILVDIIADQSSL